jgi:hypothetical protein
VVTESVDLAVAARFALVDFDGRSDARSLRTIVASAAPRQIAVVGAAAGDAAAAAAGWREDLARFRSRVVAPGACGAAPPLGVRLGLRSSRGRPAAAGRAAACATACSVCARLGA